MTDRIYLEQDGTAVWMGRHAFPNYAGRKYSLRITDGEVEMRSCWSGGSRDSWVVLRLEDMKHQPVPQNGSGFEATLKPWQMQPGYAVVQHSIFRGRDYGITIYLHPDNAVGMIPEKAELSRAEQIVLVATRCYKSSYGGRTRFEMANDDIPISQAEWDTAKAALIDRKLLNKAGAITDAGRNACPASDLYRLRKAEEAGA